MSLISKEKKIEVSENRKEYWEAYYENYGITMVYIPPGNFTMGQTKKEEEWLIKKIGKNNYKNYKNETPAHDVSLDGYWIGQNEITNQQYVQFLNDSGIDHKNDCQGYQCIDTNEESKYSHIKGSKGNYSVLPGFEKYPITDVSWHGALEYCKWLTKKTGFTFTLPTEAQWEKAARCYDLIHEKRYLLFPWGNQEPDKTLANFNSNNTVPINVNKGLSPYGLLNMAGNVWEWCSDWYDESYYSKSPRENPTGPPKGRTRVRRGGGFNNPALSLRCAGRSDDDPQKRYSNVGFRLCMKNKKNLNEQK
jgi:formylglycine-generating enzyme required for sulfatase activity